MVGLAIVGGLALVAIVMFTKPGVLIKGFLNLFVKNVAQTPEGAEAIYQEAIEKTQDKYNEASNALQRVAGQLHTANENLVNANKKLKECEAKCERLVASGKEKEALYFAEERELIITDIEQCEVTISELEPIYNEAEEIKLFQEKELKRLKLEQKTVVDNLRRNIQVKEMYDTMDELKKNSNLDKMMGYVKEGAQEKKEQAIGARVEHNSKLSTKIERAEAEAKRLSGSAYLESIKAKQAASNNAAFEVKERINNKL